MTSLQPVSVNTSEGHNDVHDQIRHCVDRVLESDDSSQVLQDILVSLESRPSIAVGVFESVAGRVDQIKYWSYYLISRAYLALGRDDACFFTAISAVKMEPSYPNWHMFENIYRYFFSSGRYREAVEIAQHQIRHTPEIPIIAPDQLHAAMQLAQITIDKLIETGSHTGRYTLYPVTRFEMKAHNRYGVEGSTSKCFALDQFSDVKIRPEVIVWELENAEIIVYDRNVLIFDRDRVLQTDLSVCEFPEILAQKVLNSTVYSNLKINEVKTSIIISDKYGTANVCHFLLDHATRLALYDSICEVKDANIIGPSLITDYQKIIIQSLGIDLDQYMGTDDRCVIRASRLLVSETCKNTFVHPAHLAADWAIEFLHRRLKFAVPDLELPKRIYISRSDASARFVHNEVTLLDTLKNHGFTNIVLSEFKYDEQVALFANATHIVGMHGAGLTNIVFCPSGASILEICHPVSGTAAYAVLAANLDIIYSAMIGHDAESSEAKYNDWMTASQELGMGGTQVLTNRNVVVDIEELNRWLRESGADA